jgi:DNA-binding PadR family transcriptional regulator
MPLAHAILGFLDHGPQTGYELKKSFDQSISHFWTATQSHIYKALEALEKEGLVGSEVIPQAGKPSRKLYRIGEAGRVELRRWTATPLPVEVSRQAWLIQVFFAHENSNDELVGLFEARIAALRGLLEACAAAQASIDEHHRLLGIGRMRELWQLSLDYGLDHYRTEIAWLEAALPRLRALPPLGPPARGPES